MSLESVLGYKIGINPQEYRTMTKSRIFTAFAAAAILSAGAAPAFAKSQDSQGNGPAGASAGDKGERKVCKRFDNTTSRMRGERVCLTKSQWKKFETQN